MGAVLWGALAGAALLGGGVGGAEERPWTTATAREAAAAARCAWVREQITARLDEAGGLNFRETQGSCPRPFSTPIDASPQVLLVRRSPESQKSSL